MKKYVPKCFQTTLVFAVKCNFHFQESAENNKTYTYLQLQRNTAAFATSLLKKLGLKPGDVVAAMLPNCPEFPVVAFGTIQAGCILTTVNPIYKECKYNLVC